MAFQMRGRLQDKVSGIRGLCRDIGWYIYWTQESNRDPYIYIHYFTTPENDDIGSMLELFVMTKKVHF